MLEHLTDEVLAGLVDGTLAGSERDRAIQHLRSCARCRDACREAGRLSGVWELAPESMAADRELDELGRSVAGVPAERVGQGGRRRWLPAASLAAAAMLVAAFLGVNHFRQEDPRPLDWAGVLGPARAVVLEASNRGPFVLPGGEMALDPSRAVTRSGYVASSESLRVALRGLYDMFDEDELLAEAARWAAAAEIATGRISAARDLLKRARPLRPEQPDLASLEAIVHYIDGELVQAESLLRWVLERQPENDAARINLALILRDGGRPDDAIVLLRRVLADRPGTALAVRSQTLLDGLLTP